MRILYLTSAFLLLWVISAMGCSREQLVPTIPPAPTPTVTFSPTATPPPPKMIFVTSTSWAGSDIASLANADALCQAQAGAAGRAGTWRAWISGGGVNAIDRIADVGPWYLVDQTTLVFNNKTGLAGAPINPIILDQYGNYVGDFGIYAWTGTAPGGTADGVDCSNWTTGASTGTIGSATLATSNWTSIYTDSCSNAYRLYCFEQ